MNYKLNAKNNEPSFQMKVTFHALDPSKLKNHEFEIKNNAQIHNLDQLINICRSEYQMEHIFPECKLPPGMLCMINNVDIECGDGQIKQNDHIVFINSLHGG